MKNYEKVLEEVFIGAYLKAKKEVENLDEFSETIGTYVIDDEINTKEKLDVISVMSEQVYFTSEEIEEHVDAMVYIHRLIVESYKKDIEMLDFEIKGLKEEK